MNQVGNWTEDLARDLDDVIENIFHTSGLDSTHLCALRLFEQLDSDSLDLGSTLIIADQQTAGTGRGERGWTSPQGGLYFSWLDAFEEYELTQRLPILAAVAAWRATNELLSSDIGIKWPNDLIVSGKKIAGLIAHVRQGKPIRATVGFGLNGETSPDLPEQSPLPPTCLAEHIEGELPVEWRGTAVRTFVRALYESLQDAASAVELWREHLIHEPGDELSVRLGSGEVFRGRLQEITGEGHLVMSGGDGERKISSGDVLE